MSCQRTEVISVHIEGAVAIHPEPMLIEPEGKKCGARNTCCNLYPF